MSSCTGFPKSVAVFRNVAGRPQRPRRELSTASQGALITSVMIQIPIAIGMGIGMGIGMAKQLRMFGLFALLKLIRLFGLFDPC